jgi:protein gp37
MGRAHWHQFQVLTKRPDRMRNFVLAKAARGGPLTASHPNVWLGTSVESQKYVYRAALVADLPVTVRFLSCEPLLGPLELGEVLRTDAIDWVIVGGESGHHARPMEASWAREIRDQCDRAHVPFFFKQWGGHNKKAAGRTLDQRTWDELPVLSSISPA